MKKLLALPLMWSLLFALVLPVAAAPRSQDDAALNWLIAQQQPDGGFGNGFSAGSDFGTTVEVILAAAAAGQDVSQWPHSPLDYIHAQVLAGHVQDANQLSRAIFAAVATGQNPRSFAGRDLVAALLAQQDANGQFGKSLYAHAYAVLALHAAGAAVPQDAVDLMKNNLTDDGGWALFGGKTPGTADTNTTAMVIQALASAGEIDAARGGLAYLHRMQNPDGGFPYQNPSPWGTETDANSTAVVLQALNALDEPLGMWVGSGTDVLGGLLALWDSSGGAYFWKASVPYANITATAQAVQAAEGMTLVSIPVVAAANAPKTTAAVATTAPLLPATGHALPLPALWGSLLLATLLWGRQVVKQRS